ncbi:TPA: hypothetical protein ACH3X3_007853 [Trebouxia sp. C0006]
MAQWYALGQQYYQPQQQLGQLPDMPYGALPHPAYLASAYCHAPYAYAGVPMAVNGMPQLWMPVKLNAAAAPYPQTFGQMQAQQALNLGQHIPFREAPQRRAPSRRTPDHDPLQMAWPDSPAGPQPSGQAHGTSAAWNTQAQSRHNSWRTASQSNPSPPQTPAAADCSRQFEQMSLSDEAASSHTPALPGRSDTSVISSAPAGIAAASEAAESSDHDAADDLDGQYGSNPAQQAQQSLVAEKYETDAVMGEAAWQWLTEGLLKDVISKMPQHCRKRCRLTCKRWRNTLDLHIQELAPSHAQIHATLDLFPGLTALDLSGCQNVRNRNLAILSKSGLNLKRLAIGHAFPISYGKPRITNQALQSIAEFRGLRQLVLADCSAVTTGGLEQLSGLQGLHSLALLRCPRVGDKGMTVLHSLTCLTYLALTGCTKVGDGSMRCVSAVTSLQSLVLGSTRVQDAGLALLTALPALTSLSLLAEGITQAGLLALSSMRGLRGLGVSQCSGVTGEALGQLLPSLPACTSLALNCLHLTDDHMDMLVKVAPQLGHLGVQGCLLGASGLTALAALSGLQCLSLSISSNTPHTLTAITCLSHLTALQVQGIGMAPGLMHHLGQLSALQGLDVHGFEGVVSGYGMHRAAPPPLLPLSCCRQLRWLDISHWTVKGAEVSRVLTQVPTLQHVCILGSPVEAELRSLEAKHPKVSFQKLPKSVMWETHTAT